MTTSLEALRRVLETQSARTHVALPGIVQAYDTGTQTVDVQPAVLRVTPSGDDRDEDGRERLPVIQSVPVAWPRAGSFYMHAPLAPGDSVLLVFCESDIGQWRHSGEVSDPGLPERHGLSGAVAIPGLYPRSATVADAGANPRVGVDGGPAIEFSETEIQAGGSSPLALAAALDAIYTAISTAAVSGSDGGAAFKAAIIATLDANPSWTGRASTVLKGS